jgi:Domain of unknown function (DUF4157)/Putative peptidoglycan binding domain
MRNLETTRANTSDSASRLGEMLQRKCACGNHTVAGGECEGCSKKNGLLQRAARGPEHNTQSSGGVPPIVREVLGSPGQPIDADTRAFFEPRFGHDFSRVRVHNNSRAAESARAVNALAYTVGSDIVFRGGRYDPATGSGKRILAHELTHVVQQHGLPAAPNRMEISPPDDSFERNADAMASLVMDSSQAARHGSSPTGILRFAGSAVQCARLQRTNGDGHKLAAPRFASDQVLQDCLDGKQFLRVGDHGGAVAKIQQALIDAGFPLLKFGADGKFGDETKAAVKSFQRKSGLKGRDVDGVIGPVTMGLLDAQFSTRPEQPTDSTSSVPSQKKVTTKTTGEIGKKEPDLEQKPTARKSLDVSPTTEGDPDRLFSLTLEFDVKNDWSFVEQREPLNPPSFLCDHGIFQVGGKINVGIKLGSSGRFEALTEPELDINLVPTFCNANPGVTAQVNLFKFRILKDIVEADLVGVLGLPDGWARGLPNFPFTGGFQGKAQFTPFGTGHSPFKNLKVGVFGNLSYQQGVKDQRPAWGVGGGVFIGHDFDFGPTKK